MLDLDAITARADAATPGPWTLEVEGPDYEAGTGAWHTGIYGPENAGATTASVAWRERWGNQVSEISELVESDAEFVVAAREDVPALVAEVRRLTAERGELVSAVEQWRAEHCESFDVKAGHALQAIIGNALPERTVDENLAILERLDREQRS